MKKISYLFIVLAILLSDIMCAVVAYNYCALQWGGQYAAYSTPASAAFLYFVPYGIGIIFCIILARFFYKKQENKAKEERQKTETAEKENWFKKWKKKIDTTAGDLFNDNNL